MIPTANSEKEDKGTILMVPQCPIGTSVKVPVGDAEYLDIGNGKLIKIANLPRFSSQKDADAFILGLRHAISNPTYFFPTIDFSSKSTHGNVRVASITYNGVRTITLWVEYSTSGDSNTGTITYHNAYTTYTGFSLGIAWNQISSHSEVTSSGKDIYATATGELSYYLLIDGLIELGRESVRLSGYCYAVH